MALPDQPEEIELHASKLYAGRSAMAETVPPSRRLGIAEIVQFLSDPQRTLSETEQRELFGNQRLRAEYRRLKAQLSVVDLPALAAASTGGITLRRFDGGTVSIHPSRRPGQVYVVIRLALPKAELRSLLLENAAGDLVKRPLPPADTGGEIMIVLDETNSSDQKFLHLISDPIATGSFL
jgi:hypothetical protein